MKEQNKNRHQQSVNPVLMQKSQLKMSFKPIEGKSRSIIRISGTLLAGILLLPLGSCSLCSRKLTLREIDRPLNMPADMKRVVPGVSGSLEDVTWKSEMDYSRLALPDLSYSLSDNVELLRLPYPLFKFQLKSKTFTDGELYRLEGLNIALIAGISEIEYEGGEAGLKNTYTAALVAKIPWNYVLWTEVGATAYMTNLEKLHSSAGGKIGVQTADPLAFSMGYFFARRQSLKHPGVVSSHYLPVSIILSPVHWFTLNLTAGGLVAPDQVSLYTGSLSTDFHW